MAKTAAITKVLPAPSSALSSLCRIKMNAIIAPSKVNFCSHKAGTFSRYDAPSARSDLYNSTLIVLV